MLLLGVVMTGDICWSRLSLRFIILTAHCHSRKVKLGEFSVLNPAVIKEILSFKCREKFYYQNTKTILRENT